MIKFERYCVIKDDTYILCGSRPNENWIRIDELTRNNKVRTFRYKSESYDRLKRRNPNCTLDYKPVAEWIFLNDIEYLNFTSFSEGLGGCND